MKKIALIASAVFIAFCASVRAEGISSLAEVGKSMADINAAMDEETKTFDRVKAAVESGAIRKGVSKADIKAQYGEPVIKNDDSATGREKWAYKSATSTFFKGIRIYLYFDDKGALDEVKIVK